MSKILLICKETFTYPMNYIKDELQNKGHTVHTLFIHSSESLYEDHSMKSFIERNDDITIFSLKNICIKYIATYKNSKKLIDLEYLQYVEKKYCKGIPLSLLQISSQLFTTQYHYRIYFKDMSESNKLYWIQLLFHFLEDLVKQNNYDKVCDLDIAEIGRSVLFQICKTVDIPYISLEFSRYKNYVLPTYTLGRKTDDYFIDLYIKNLNKSSSEYSHEIETFREMNEIMTEDYKRNSTSKNKKNTFRKDFITLLYRWKEISRRLPKWLYFKKNPLLANSFLSYKHHFLRFFRERILFSKHNKIFELPTAGEKYVYFPLHLIPESTTLNKSPFYPNEVSVIEAISKSLPVGCKLYVKEHGAMIGERPIIFYKKIKKLTNIKLVDLSFYNDPKPWIMNSIGVITLSGTSSFEAAMLGKPSALFGNTFFEVIDGIYKVNSFTDIPMIIEKFEEYKESNLNSLSSYIKTVKSNGYHIPILKILDESRNAILNNRELDAETYIYIKNLVKLFGY